MEQLIGKWIKETASEYQRAKDNQNLYQMHEMKRLKDGLITLRDKLLKSNRI